MGGGARGASGGAHFFDGVLHAFLPLFSRVVAGAFQADDAVRSHDPVLRDSIDLQRVGDVAVRGKNREGKFLVLYKRIDQARILIHVKRQKHDIRLTFVLFGEFL